MRFEERKMGGEEKEGVMERLEECIFGGLEKEE